MSYPSINPAGTGSGGGSSFPLVNVPLVQIKTIVLADTEYSQALPINTKRFTIQNRDNGLLKISYVTGFTTVYFSIFPGGSITEDLIGAANITVYLQSPKAGQTVEILTWT